MATPAASTSTSKKPLPTRFLSFVRWLKNLANMLSIIIAPLLVIWIGCRIYEVFNPTAIWPFWAATALFFIPYLGAITGIFSTALAVTVFLLKRLKRYKEEEAEKKSRLKGAALGAPSLMQDLPEIIRWLRFGGFATTTSTTLLVASLAISVANGPSRVPLVSFYAGMTNACALPLHAIANDITAARDAAQQHSSDQSGLSAALSHYASVLQTDADTATHFADALARGQYPAPDPKYQGIVDDCRSQLQFDVTGLTSESLNPGAPIGAAQGLTGVLHQAQQASNGSADTTTIAAEVVSVLNLSLSTPSPVQDRLKQESSQFLTDLYAPFQPDTSVLNF